MSEKKFRRLMKILTGCELLPKEAKYLSGQFVGRLATSVKNKPHVTPVRFGFKYGKIFIDIAKDYKK
ncbi:hypothetical protein J7K27_09550 [Candidatus Bathyarchaeota archaeon]|nr:hypothetical protein [Candidatus Bathyarchaeota archaeon]